MNNPDQISSSLSSVPRFSRQPDYKTRISRYSSKMEQRSSGLRASSTEEESTDTDSETDELIQLLALQSYHLPGNSWAADWYQFMANNHPVFGICCHNPVHPIKSWTRIVALIGTITFGLAMTNLFYLFFLWNPEYNRVLASYTTEGGTELLLTTGMLLVWTVGGGVHCTFNLAMWYIAACACCQRGGFCESYACCPKLGKYMVRFFVACTLVFCIMVILLRVAINDHEQQAESATINPGIDIMIDDQIKLSVTDASEFMFVMTYLVEITLSLFVYYPLGGTMLFSGIWACGFRIPVLGGRPYEIAGEERRNARRQREEDSSKRGSRIEV